ncbi:HDIG domain-containing protein [Heliobacterium gestii]|uniref:HDIG domain-containing protein n=1 Tax=Heliomicrobium gestii TaxID=2699 RepID=A0A845LC76_HELGE|nr:HDIG domain-containing metalloprotein [Heliomicrobium gestii]MBM7867996.1 putative nucleotidyltransferase with HDIG domain [Heliomicrobium gestii]MZP44262.1 HDIG domain-containing protein [Heliomicrobium gestii]
MAYSQITALLTLALRKIWQYRTTRRIVYGFTFFLIYTVILALPHLSSLETLEAGQKSQKDIKSPITKEIVDEERTRLAREQKVNATPPVYTHDPNVTGRSQRDIDQFFKSIADYQRAGTESANADPASSGTAAEQRRWEQLKVQMNVAAPETLLRKLVSLRPESLAFIQTETQNQISDMLSMPGLTETLDEMPQGMPLTRAAGRVLPYSIQEAHAIVLERIDNSVLTQESKEILRTLIPLFLRANSTLDVDATKRLRSEVRQSVAPITFLIRKDDVIVRAGDIVSDEQIQLLAQLELLRTGDAWLKPLGMALLVLLNMTITLWYLRTYRRDFYLDERMLLLLGLMAMMTLLTARIVASINLHEQRAIYDQLLYVIPAATGPMLIAILLDSRVAIFMSAVLSVFIGIITDASIPHAIVAWIGSLVGVYSVSRFSQRMDFARSGLIMAVANALTVFAIGLAAGVKLPIVATYGLPMAVVNGILSSVFMIGSLPYLESAFKLTTSVKLLELANPNHPLLRRLLMEAPGTYHHSLLVGNLGEAAAEMIGADALLVRLGAYYHDVGKIRRPAFFIENQAPGQNPHDKIAPSLSTLIITSHVKDGAELCREAGLPPQVVDLVEQHHGNTLVSFFYHRAREADRTESVQEGDFRYEGPKPQSKEAALVMLADTVEAAVRSLSQPTSGKIEGLVRKLIKEKLNDGQLEECDLTFKDLDRVAQAFCRVFNGIYHTRIEYPEGVSKELDGRKRSGTVYSG